MKRKNETSKELTLFDKNNRYDAGILENIGREGDMLSLTDLWKATGSPANKRPIDWQEKESTKEFIDALSDTFQSAKIALWKTKRGGTNPGTYGIRQIALAYAKWIDPALHILVNEVFFQRIEEEKNPDLIVDRAIETYKRRGYDEKWISQRLKGKGTRNEFTSCLAAHGVEREGFRNCTNAIYSNIYGGSTDVIREKKNLTKKANIRDSLTSEEISTIEFAEMLARNTIKANNLTGNGQCELASSNASKIAANAVIQSRKTLTF